MEETRNKYRIFWGKPLAKHELWRSRRRYEDTIKIDLRKVGCLARRCMERVQRRPFAFTVMNL